MVLTAKNAWTSFFCLKSVLLCYNLWNKKPKCKIWRPCSKSISYPLPLLCKLMTVSQNGRYVKLQIMGWIGIWHVLLFVLKIFCNPSLHMSHQSAKLSFPVQTGLGAWLGFRTYYYIFKSEEDLTSFEFMLHLRFLKCL